MKGIQAFEYTHEHDRQALEAMKAIPGFSAVLKAFMKLLNENAFHSMNIASKIRLSDKQLPDLYNLLPPICERLCIDTIPEMYLEMNPYPNAYTSGDTQVYITVTSGLVDTMSQDELRAVIAHECGHIACHHVLYHTMGTLLLNGGANILGLGMLTVPLQLALFYWQRCSELSCDRAAALYMGSADPVVNTMLRLSGGGKGITSEVDMSLFLEQGEEYERAGGDSAISKALQYLLVMNQSHPFTVVRAHEITKWCASDRFAAIIGGKGADGVPTCPKCGTPIKDDWRFCKQCGSPCG